MCLRMINGVFTAMVGTRLGDAVKEAFEYSKVNNISVVLEFNGVFNRIEPWINPDELTKEWFNNLPSNWCELQKAKLRNNKLQQLGIE